MNRASWPSALSSSVLSWTRSAATTSEPRPSSTAAAIPAVPAAATTGGATRSRASARTSGCASGRKTRSHTSSVPSRGFRDRARALNRKSALARDEQLPGRVELVPDVPEEDAARPAVLDVRDYALPIRLLPVLDGLEARVDRADGLVAEAEEIGVEERQVVVGRVGAGHVRSDGASVRL